MTCGPLARGFPLGLSRSIVGWQIAPEVPGCLGPAGGEDRAKPHLPAVERAPRGRNSLSTETMRLSDLSESMLALARRRRPPEGAGEIRFVAGNACALPFAGEAFDAVVATQVHEYVQDIPAALGEAFRVLRPGGRLLVLDTDWGSMVWHSRDAERMRHVLAAWEEHLVDPHLPRRLTGL